MTESGEVDVLIVEEQVCFALYSASRAITDVYRPLLGELGLTYPQYLVLLALWEEDARSVKRLGETLQLDYGTLSPLLKRLEANGLVTRTRLATDERSVTVSLTDEGAALRERAAHIPTAIGCSIGMDTPAAHRLIVQLRRITALATASARRGAATG